EAVAVLREVLDHLLLPRVDDRQTIQHRQPPRDGPVEQPPPHVRQRVVVSLSKVEDRHGWKSTGGRARSPRHRWGICGAIAAGSSLWKSCGSQRGAAAPKRGLPATDPQG